MRVHIVGAAVIIALACGCSGPGNHRGAPAENDQNVLTGGPVTGTRIVDLPQAVRDTLKERVPNAEVADIDKQNRDGLAVYRITLSRPAVHPTLYISGDGHVLSGMSNRERLEGGSKE
jgi:hypothetical protein